jgi:hypothetical protein
MSFVQLTGMDAASKEIPLCPNLWTGCESENNPASKGGLSVI